MMSMPITWNIHYTQKPLWSYLTAQKGLVDMNEYWSRVNSNSIIDKPVPKNYSKIILSTDATTGTKVEVSADPGCSDSHRIKVNNLNWLKAKSHWPGSNGGRQPNGCTTCKGMRAFSSYCVDDCVKIFFAIEATKMLFPNINFMLNNKCLYLFFF